MHAYQYFKAYQYLAWHCPANINSLRGQCQARIDYEQARVGNLRQDIDFEQVHVGNLGQAPSWQSLHLTSAPCP